MVRLEASAQGHELLTRAATGGRRPAGAGPTGSPPAGAGRAGSPLRPLHSRNFALVWSAALVSNAGSWMQTVALGVLVTARTHQPLWTGLVAAAAFVPIGLLSPVGGALADRFDRRSWLTATTFAELAVAAALAGLAATGTTSPGLVVVVAFLGGSAAALGFPAYQALLPDLVPSEDLVAAVSLSSAQFNLGRVVGPALAGLALVAGGYTLAFAANAASFLAVVVALALVRLEHRATGHGVRESLHRRVVAGVRIALAEPGCRAAIGSISVVALLVSPFIALVPAMAIDVFHRGASATSMLVTAQGIGAVVGALVLPALAARVGPGRAVVGALAALPVAAAAYGLAPTFWLSAAALAVLGACYLCVLSGLNTVVQLRAPERARGRVLGVYLMGLGLVYPLGAVLQGAVAGSGGLRAVTVAGAAGLGILLVVVAVAARPVLAALAAVGPRVGDEPAAGAYAVPGGPGGPAPAVVGEGPP